MIRPEFILDIGYLTGLPFVFKLRWLVKAAKRFGLVPKEDFALVHVQDVETVAGWLFASS